MRPEVAFLLLPIFCPPYGQHPWLCQRSGPLLFLLHQHRRRFSFWLCLLNRSWVRSSLLLSGQFVRLQNFSCLFSEVLGTLSQDIARTTGDVSDAVAGL